MSKYTMINLSCDTLAHLCLESSSKFADRKALAMLKDGEICGQISYEEMGFLAKQAAAFLAGMGIKKGNKLLILSENSPQWPVFYFAIALSGGVSIPLLTGFSSEQIDYLAKKTDVSGIIISRPMMEKFQDIDMDSYQNIPFIFLDSVNNGKITVLLDSKEIDYDLPSEEEIAKNEFPSIGSNDLATIIFTSGTHGNSKGVMLSGENIIASAIASMSFFPLFPRDRLLSVLPLAHAYECSIGLLAPILSGSAVYYLDKPPSPSVLIPALKKLRPSAMLSVPLLIEKIYRNSISGKLKENPLYKFPLTRILAIRIAGRKLLSALGGRLRVFGIGGASLSNEVEAFLRKAGFPYTIGYGLTEAAPLVAGARPKRFPLYSVGYPAKGVSIRLHYADSKNTEGEIQVKGPNIMMGYFNDEEKTSEAFTNDGWLKTGDLGRFDKKGCLHIKGRLKALILGPSGENIYPEEIEGLLGTSQLIDDVLVYASEKGELIALVILSDAAKAAAGAIENSLEELRSWANKKLSAFSRLSRIEIKREPFEKTPTMKIKRYLYI